MSKTKMFTPGMKCPACLKEPEWKKALTTDSGDIFSCNYCNLSRKGEIDAEKIYYQHSRDKETLERDSRSYINEQSIRMFEAQKVINRINEIRDNKKGKMLDIGCAAGFLSKTAYDDGWEITGIDKNPLLTSYAKNTLNVDSIYTTAIDDFLQSNLDNKYDAVVIKNVLGHLNNPGEVVMNAGKHQERGDLLFIQTPDVSCSWANSKVPFIRRHWPYFNTYLWFFSPKSIKSMLKNCGYKVTHIEVFPLYLSFSLFYQRLFERCFVQTLPEGNLRHLVWKTNQSINDIMRRFGMGRLHMKTRLFKDIINVYAIKE